MKPHFLRNVLCVSIALSLLITSVQLPLRQAGAIAPLAIPAAGATATASTVATWAPVVNTLAMIGIYSMSSEADQKKCAQKFLNNSKAQFCISPKNGTLEAFIVPAVTYARVVCPTLAQNCLQSLLNKAKPFLRDLEKKLAKNPVAFKSLCPVLLTLVGMTITEYCKANGYDVPNATASGIGTVPPKKGGGGGKTGSMGILPFLQQITSWVSAAVQRLLDNCPAWLKKLVPFCKEASASKPPPTPTITRTSSAKINREKEIWVEEQNKRNLIFNNMYSKIKKRANEKNNQIFVFRDAFPTIPEMQAILYETLLIMHDVVTAQLRKPINSRDSTVYRALQDIFIQCVQEIGSIEATSTGQIKYRDSFTAPLTFKHYTYTNETSRIFLLKVLGKSVKEVDPALSRAIETFEKITELLSKEDAKFPPFFWDFVVWDLNDMRDNPSPKTKK